jgi:dienelactone hydrolase
MAQDTVQDHISKKVVVYRLPGVDSVNIRRDEPYATPSGPLAMDLYYPPHAASATRLPAVVIVAGFPDLGTQKILGCKFKEMGSSTSWACLIAVSGIVAITYTNREPAADLQALLQYVRHNAPALGIDGNRIGLWASSGHVPLALWTLMQEPSEFLKCAVFCYGYSLDDEGSTTVADAARTWGFVNPAAGKSVDDLPSTVPLLIARAGRDQFANLNDRLDRFVAKALSRNLPVTIVNHATGPHAFDLFDDSDPSREIVKQILAFLQFNLGVTERTERTEETV